MAQFTGQVEYTPGGPTKFKVVFRMAGELISELPVQSQEEGETIIVEMLRGLEDFAKRGGYI